MTWSGRGTPAGADADDDVGAEVADADERAAVDAEPLVGVVVSGRPEDPQPVSAIASSATLTVQIARTRP